MYWVSAEACAAASDLVGYKSFLESNSFELAIARTHFISEEACLVSVSKVAKKSRFLLGRWRWLLLQALGFVLSVLTEFSATEIQAVLSYAVTAVPQVIT